MTTAADLRAQADALARAGEVLRAAESILFVTGAGISADSGLPTYRGIGGLYESREADDDGMPIERALSASVFRDDPACTWRHIHALERACRGAQPNAAHLGIAAFERERERVRVLTQNVDGLHRLAGSVEVIEIHGNLHDLECTACRAAWTVVDYARLDPVPACSECGGQVRPRVVLFEERLPAAALRRLEHELALGFDAVVSVGTTSVFPYIAQPILLARAHGKATIEINPGDSRVSEIVDLKLAMGAARALDALWTRARRAE